MESVRNFNLALVIFVILRQRYPLGIFGLERNMVSFRRVCALSMYRSTVTVIQIDVIIA